MVSTSSTTILMLPIIEFHLVKGTIGTPFPGAENSPLAQACALANTNGGDHSDRCSIFSTKLDKRTLTQIIFDVKCKKCYNKCACVVLPFRKDPNSSFWDALNRPEQVDRGYVQEPLEFAPSRLSKPSTRVIMPDTPSLRFPIAWIEQVCILAHMRLKIGQLTADDESVF